MNFWPFKKTPLKWKPEWWIDASEHQPEVMQEVIVYAHPFPKSEIYVGWYDGQYWVVRGHKCRVTHWIPFPNPPLLGVEAQPG